MELEEDNAFTDSTGTGFMELEKHQLAVDTCATSHTALPQSLLLHWCVTTICQATVAFPASRP
jgi:hypothetical protein